jgi:hypothetical protein
MQTGDEIEARIIELNFEMKSLENRMEFMLNRKNYAYDQYVIAKREHEDYYNRIEDMRAEIGVLSGVLK